MGERLRYGLLHALLPVHRQQAALRGHLPVLRLRHRLPCRRVPGVPVYHTIRAASLATFIFVADLQVQNQVLVVTFAITL